MAVTIIVVWTAVLTACSGQDGAQVASVGGGAGPASAATGDSALTPQQKGQRMVECLRENGLPVGDADEEGNMGYLDAGADKDPVAATAAFTACADVMYQPPLSPEDEARYNSPEAARAFTECMRGKGLDWPDPNPDGSSNVTPDDDFGVDQSTLMSYATECLG